MVIEVIIGDAIVHLLCAPFRRIMMIQAVQLDLEEEHFPNFRSLRRRRVGQSREKSKKKREKAAKRRSAFDFRHMGDAARFLYSVGGIRFFFCGGLLDVASVFLKYYLQVFLIIPLFRRLPPLPMSSFVLFSTFVHTIVLFFPVASVQCVVSALVVNRVTDFVRTSLPSDSSTGSCCKAKKDRKPFSFVRSMISRLRVALHLDQPGGGRYTPEEEARGEDNTLQNLRDMATEIMVWDIDKQGQLESSVGKCESTVLGNNSGISQRVDREEYIGHAVVVGCSGTPATATNVKSRQMFLSSGTPPVLTFVQEQAGKRVRVSAMTPKKHGALPLNLSYRMGVSPVEEQRGLLGLNSSSRRSSGDRGIGVDPLTGPNHHLSLGHLENGEEKNRRLSLEMMSGFALSPSCHTLSSGAFSPKPGLHYLGATGIDGNSEAKEKFIPRFSSWKEVVETLYHELPVIRFLKKMTFIEFMSRYFSSVVNNILVTRLYSHLAPIDYSSSPAAGGFLLTLSTWIQSLCFRRGIPLAVSIGVSLVTYPLATIPFVHFMRLAHYEYLRRESAAQRLDEELNGYLLPPERRSVTITPMVVSAPTSPGFHSSPCPSITVDGHEKNGKCVAGSRSALESDSNLPPSSDPSDRVGKKEMLVNCSDENVSFAGGRFIFDQLGGSWMQVEMDENELLDENNLHYNHPRNLKTSISLGNWWVESIVLKLYHVDVRGYLSVIMDTHGFLALYNGWGGYVSQLIFQSVAGELIQEVIGRLFAV